MRHITAGFLVATVLAVGLVSACGTQNGTASDTAARTAARTAVNTGSTGAANKGEEPAGGADGTPIDDLRFPGTTVTAELTGFDHRLRMINFEVVERAPGTGQMEPHYVDLPGDGPHRLPLAPNLKVRSASIICSTQSEHGVTVDAQGRGDQPCTTDELLAALDSRPGITAELKVDAQDRIYEVAELYHP